MSSQPKRNRVVGAMTEIAREEQGPEATPLDFICDRLSGGLVLREIADELSLRLGETMNTEWLRSVVVKLSPDSKERMSQARAGGAVRFLEDALDIADSEAYTPASVARNRLRADVRRDLARSFDPSLREGKQGSAPTVNVSFGTLLLQVHRAIESGEIEILRPEQLTAGTPGETAPAPAGETDFEVISAAAEEEK